MKTSLRNLLFVCLLTLFVSSEAEAESLTNLTFTIPGKVRGIMDRPSPNQEVVYHFKGINFITSTKGGIHSSYIVNFAGQPTAVSPASDPFVVIRNSPPCPSNATMPGSTN